MTLATAPLLLTMGDPAGIGPEITVKAWQVLRHDQNHSFAVIGAPDLYDKNNGLETGCPVEIIDQEDLPRVSEIFKRALPVLPLELNTPVKLGQPNSDTAASTLQSIEYGVKLCLGGQGSAIVTNPIAKDVLYQAGFNHPGHTEYLGALTADAPDPYFDPAIRGPVMMLSGGGLRVALATVHVSLADAVKTLSVDKILRNARAMNAALKFDFGIARPRIALCGLNPHAGENGTIGREEIEIINPAAAILRAEGLDVTDAQSADTLFHAEARAGYDAVLAMYHDQGLIPVKTLDFHGGVNITLGLPIVRTSPDHGTAFNIAGKGLARPDSLMAAIRAATEIASHRFAHV